MASLTPPPSAPLVATGDHDRLRRLHFRLWQITAAALTTFAAGWCCTLGVLPGLIALLVAKHVLVAILVMGLGLNAPLD